MGLFNFIIKKNAIEPQLKNVINVQVRNIVQKKGEKIVRKARGTEIPKRTQRVFLCCDTHNASDRDILIADLLSMDAGMDCVVSYFEIPATDIDEKLLRNELQDTQLLVLLVTEELLQSFASGNYPMEYRIAQKDNVLTPILPIAKDGSLFPLFTNLAGAVHGIAISDIEYRTKLKAQMETFLVTEEVIKQIQEKAFTAEIFLSYRKMDIDEARRFMKTLHDLKEFEAVSIWYDNFLTAGRIFDDEISESICKSDAFVLLVTPNLLKKNEAGMDNYVVSTEYPFALQKGKPVVPVETIYTNPTNFATLFPEAGDTVSLDNLTALRTAFRDKLGNTASIKQLDSERAYLLGGAYLKGFGVERDVNRAIRLMEVASEVCSETAYLAAKALARIYERGIGISINYNKALYWRKLSIIYEEKLIGIEPTETADSYNEIAEIYIKQGDYQNALECYQDALTIYEKVLGKKHTKTADIYNNIGVVYKGQSDYQNALKYYQKALKIYEKVFGKEHSRTATTYNNIGVIYESVNYSKALEWQQKALKAREKILGKEHPDTAQSYDNFGVVYFHQNDFPKALEWYQKALEVREKVQGKEHPDTAGTYRNIGQVYHERGNLSKALEWYQKALVIWEKVRKWHPDTARTYVNVGVICAEKKDFVGALEWNQKALAIAESVLGKEHTETAQIYLNLGIVYTNLKNLSEAQQMALRATSIYSHSLGMNHPKTQTASRVVEYLYTTSGGNKNDFQRWLQNAIKLID